MDTKTLTREEERVLFKKKYKENWKKNKEKKIKEKEVKINEKGEYFISGIWWVK
jgi:hypothetical protein